MGESLKALAESGLRLPEPENFFAGLRAGAGLLLPENIILFTRHSASGKNALIREYHKWLHNRHLLVVTLKGGLRAVLDDSREYALKAGTALVVRPYQMHYWYNFTKSYEILFITFDLPPGGGVALPNRVFALDEPHRHHVARILEARLQPEPDLNGLVFHLGLLLSEILRAGEEEGQALSTDGSLIDRIARHVQSNLNKPLELESIAAAFGYSTGHLCRIFKQAGIGNLGAFIREARFQVAESLLVSTDLSVKEIVQRCGFGSVPTFIREFRRLCKVSPRQFRKHARDAAEGDAGTLGKAKETRDS